MIEPMLIDDLEEALKVQDKLHYIMVFGTGCGPCEFSKPLYQMLVTYFNRLGANIQFYMVDAWNSDQQQKVTERFSITGVPTFVGIYNGTTVMSRPGGGDIHQLKNTILETIDEVNKTFGVKI